ncbi:MAG: DUF4347 domain-containing protein [Candidatus Thiodiazotropha sp. (ex Monitilora ramsayi)]|nr:DUF4347 domain-containing protein [Candidatus Thiodiazotropha sp. (ex Monitilora ramsayi)]
MSRPRPRRAHTLVFEELEPRLLLSADLAGIAVDPVHYEADDQVDGDELLAIERTLQDDHLLADVSEAGAGSYELVIIDTDTLDYQSLVDDLIDREGSDINFEIVLLDSAGNGIEQIGHILDQYRDLDAVHLISHGGDGEVRLANATLDLSALNDSSEQIGGWGDAFAAEGDLLIYGCNLASTADGELFIDRLAQLTGADVAASDDLTGAATQGGDWDLEYQLGTVEAGIAFSGQLQSSWNGTLDITTGLVGHYDFEEGSGSTAIDSSATGNNGTLIGPPVYTAGEVGSYALSFNGDFDRIEAPDSLATNFGTGNFAVSFWFNSTYSGGTARLVGDMDGGDGYVFYTTGAGDVTFGVVSGIDSVALVSGGLFDGNWHHVVGMVNGADWSLYVDGTLADSVNNGFIGNIDNSNTLRIGASSASHNEYDGLIDDVRLYDRALAMTDINELFALAEDPPTITGASLTLTEGQTVTLGGANFTISDPDSSSFTYSLSSVTGGYFQLSTNPGVSITSFTSANLTGGLVQFVDNGDETAPAFSVTVNDGTSDSNTQSATINYTPENDAPGVVNLDGDILNYSEGDGVVLIEQGSDVVVSDPDSSNFAGGSLTVEVDSGLQAAEDKFSIVNQGTGTGQIGLNVSDVSYSGVVIGTLSGGTGIDPLTVTLNSNATSAAVTALIRNISYENSNVENPTAGSRSVVVDITDGDGGTSITQNLTLNVTAVNDAPVVDLNGSNGAGADFAVTFTEGAGAVNVVDTDATISDVDSVAYENLSINLSGFLDGGSEQIVIAGYTFAYGTADTVTRTVGSTSFAIDFDGSGFNVTLGGVGSMPEADLQTLLRGVTYENSSQDPTAGDRTIDIFAQDSSLLAGSAATSTITVNPQNDGPTATNNTNTVSENGFVSGNVITDDSGSGIDSDPEGDPLQVTQVDGGAYTPGLPVTLASGAQVTFQSNGSYTYNTSGQFDGLGAGNSVDDSFTYQVSDGNGGFDTATVTITINGSNDAPVLDSASLTVSEGQTVTLSGANFGITDPDSSSFTYTVSGVTGGYFQLSTNPGVSITSFTSANLTGGLVQFVDNGDETAPAFSVTVNDGTTDSNTLGASISYTAGNDVPVLDSASLTVSEGQTVTLSGANFSITDPDDTAFTYTVSGVAGGYFQLSSNPGVSITSFTSANLTGGLVQFVDNGDETAPAFSVTVSDGANNSNTLAAVISYTAVDDQPTITSAELTLTEGQTVILSNTDIVISDPDSIDFKIFVSGISGGYFQLGSAIGTPITAFGSDDLLAGLVQFVDNGDEVAPSFSVTAYDGTTNSIPLAAAINFTLLNDVPSITNASLILSEGQTVTLSGTDFGVTDLDDTAFTYTVSGVTGGYFQLSTNPGVSITSFTSANLTGGLVQFVDNGDEIAPSFSVTVNDGTTDSNTLAASVTFTNSNDAPVLDSASLTLGEGQTVTLSVANFGITDPDDTAFTYTVSGVTGGYFQLSSNPGVSITSFTSANLTGGLVQFVDNGDEVAPAFSVTVNDGSSDSNTLAATIIYTTGNDDPVVNSASLAVSEGQTVTLSSANFGITDPDDTAFTYTVSGVTGGYFQLSSNPGVSITSFTSANLTGGLVQFVDNGDETAPAFSVTVNDGASNSNTLAAGISYTALNDAPIANSDIAVVDEGGSVIIDVAGNDADSDDGLNVGAIVIAVSPSNGTLIDNGDGTFLYIHDGSETVSDSFAYTIDDVGGATSNSAVVSVSVNPINDAPVITSHAGNPDVTLSIDENQSNASLVSATDAESGVTYSISGGDDLGLFAIDPVTGLLSFVLSPDAENPLDQNGDNIHHVDVSISDGDGGVSVQRFTIIVNDVDEFDVGLLMDMQSDEDQVTTQHLAGSDVGIRVWAADPDVSNNEVVYSLVDDADGYFVIDSATGALTLAQPIVSAETTQMEVMVRATSADGSFSERSFTIDVIPLTDPPVDVTEQTLDEVIVDLLPDDPIPDDGTDEVDTARQVVSGGSPILTVEDEEAEEESGDGQAESDLIPNGVDILEQSAEHTDWSDRSMTWLYETESAPHYSYRSIDLTPESVDIDRLPGLDTLSVSEDIAVPKAVWALLDAMNVEMSEHQSEVSENSEMVFQGVTLGAVGLTAGYVAWLLRAGILSASLLSFSPLWRQVDPLPVLSASAKTGTGQDDDEAKEGDQERRISKWFEGKKRIRDIWRTG